MIKSNNRSTRSFANPISFSPSKVNRNSKRKGSWFCFGIRRGVAISNISAQNDNKRQRIIRFAGCFGLLLAIQMINSVQTIFYLAPSNGTDYVTSTTKQVEITPKSQVNLLVKTSQTIENSSSNNADIRRRISDGILEQPASVEFTEESKLENESDVKDLEEPLEKGLIVEDSNVHEDLSDKDKVSEEFDADVQSKDHPEPEAIDTSDIDKRKMVEEGTDIPEPADIESTTDLVDETSYTEVLIETGSKNSDISPVIDAATTTNDVSAEKQETDSIGDLQSEDRPEPEEIGTTGVDEIVKGNLEDTDFKVDNESIVAEGTDNAESSNIKSTTNTVDESSYDEVSTVSKSNNNDVSPVTDSTTIINDVNSEKEETDGIGDLQSEDRPEPEETGITGIDEIVENSNFKVDSEEATKKFESTNVESTTSRVDTTSNEEPSKVSTSNNNDISPVLDATTTKIDINTEIEDDSSSMGGIAISENNTAASTENSNSAKWDSKIEGTNKNASLIEIDAKRREEEPRLGSSLVPDKRLMTIEQILKPNNINIANAASRLRTRTEVEKEPKTTNTQVNTVSNDTATNDEEEPVENDDGVYIEENDSSNPKRKAIETLVQRNDYIYRKGRTWDGPPVVLEEFKLIFFTSAKVGCSVWKTLFRRMMHFEDWRVFGENGIPWNPRTNGLTYLYDYDLQTASDMMTSPEWTRAMFVRDPKERFVSAYLDKVVGHPAYMYAQCCRKKKVKVEKVKNRVPSSQFYMHVSNETAQERFLRQRKELQQHWNPSNIKNPPDLNAVRVVEVKKSKNETNDNCANRSVLKLAEGSPQAFLKRVMSWCDNSHWRRQSQRVEDKYWPYINFVGYMDRASEDAERLLRHVGAWEDFGASGWTTSESSKEGGPVFAKKQSQGRRHATFASEKLKTYITSYGFERALERHYAEDYAHPILNFTLHRIFESPNNNDSLISLKARAMYDSIHSTKLRKRITTNIQNASLSSFFEPVKSE